MPDLLVQLRPEIDTDRRPGRFLLLGSASGVLLRPIAESLAGRVSDLELPPLQWPEPQTRVQSTVQSGGVARHDATSDPAHKATQQLLALQSHGPRGAAVPLNFLANTAHYDGLRSGVEVTDVC